MRLVVTTAWRILQKDLLVELRTREVLATMGLFALLVVIVFAFSFTIDAAAMTALGPGIIWVTLLFAGNLGVARVYDRERLHGGLTGLMLAPGGPVAVYLAKAAGVILFMCLIQLLVVPLALIFVQIDIPDGALAPMVVALVLGTIGFGLVASLFGAMLNQAHLREVLIPLIVYPVVIPLVIAGVSVTGAGFRGAFDGDTAQWLWLMGGVDLIFVALCPWIFARVMIE